MRRSDSPRTVLIYVGLDLLGDALIKLPFLRAVRAAFPGAHITWLAGHGPTVFASTLAPLAKGLIDTVVENAGISGGEWLPIRPRPLAGQRFDLIIDTQRRVRTTLALRRIRHRVFVSGALGWTLSDRAPVSGRHKRTALVAQLLALVEAASGQPAATVSAPLPIDPAMDAAARQLLPDRNDGRLYIGLAPGASVERKLWPLDRYLELAERLTRGGHIPVMLLGPYEQSWTEGIRARLPDLLLPLPDGASPLLTIAVGRRLAAAVANDSGQGHLLAAVDVPLVSLFGPSPADKFPPMTPRLAIIRAQDFGATAMAAIPIDAVERAVIEMLAGANPVSPKA